MILSLFFLTIILVLINTIVLIRKSYEYRCIKIRKDLKKGKRAWYIASVENGLVYAILPLKNSESSEFGKFDKSVPLRQDVLVHLLKNEKDKISNYCFVERILQNIDSEISIEKYEPATKL